MSINSTLKKEGINVISQLNTMQINQIASNISEKLSKAFPEHNIDQSDLFISIARLNMYIAEFSGRFTHFRLAVNFFLESFSQVMRVIVKIKFPIRYC